MQPDGDFEFWRWVGSALVGLISGSAITGWVGRGVIAKINQDNVKLNAKIDTVKADLVAKIGGLEATQMACPGRMRIEVDGLVEKLVNRMVIQHCSQMEGVRTDLAVITALQGEVKEDIKAMFDRQLKLEQDVGSMRETLGKVQVGVSMFSGGKEA